MSSVANEGLNTDIQSLRHSVGLKLGPSEWTEITQEAVDQFADLTGDHNFIHVDPDRAKQSPFGGTIAHGFLTLALIAPITQQLTVTDAAASINYGLDKVRFPAPVPVGARCRGRAEVVEVSEVKGGVQAKLNVTIEIEGGDRPAVVAEFLARFLA